jgi:hypothetical protein
MASQILSPEQRVDQPSSGQKRARPKLLQLVAIAALANDDEFRFWNLILDYVESTEQRGPALSKINSHHQYGWVGR